jgi:hypothetical protein
MTLMEIPVDLSYDYSRSVAQLGNSSRAVKIPEKLNTRYSAYYTYSYTIEVNGKAYAAVI